MGPCGLVAKISIADDVIMGSLVDYYHKNCSDLPSESDVLNLMAWFLIYFLDLQLSVIILA